MKTTSRPAFSLYLSDLMRRLLCRPAARWHRGLLFLGAGASLVSTPPVSAVELPIPCVSGSCGNNSVTQTPITWVTSGAASAVSSGTSMTVTQSTENVTLNWQSFNISADGKVIFSQPSTNSIALNRIFQASPSQILGSIKTQLNSDASKSGGQVYLVNPNGFVFGQNASVNAAGILVSTLGISEDIFSKGLLSSVTSQSAALGNDPNRPATSFIQAAHTYLQDAQGIDVYFDANGNQIPYDASNWPPGNGTRVPVQIVVKDGAKLSADTAGRILLASQSIDNAGTLSSPEGQVILAAGDRVYLSASTDNSLRGLLVEVAAGGTAWNELTGNISADHGNVTLMGLAVNQDGRISAKTSVSENGSVRLLARDSLTAPTIGRDAKDNLLWASTHTGLVNLGSNSVVDVSADLADTTTAVDDQKQLAPTVNVVGKQIVMHSGANITAHGGALTMEASGTAGDLLSTDADARIRIDSGAVIDVSGTDAVRSVADNIVTVELRGAELADSPDQRNGALRGKAVTVDARVGTPLADVKAAIANIGKTVAQRTSQGGTAVFNSTGDVVTAKDATINVSGGQTTFTGAMVNTSQLITADGKAVDIGSAKQDVTYVGVVSPTTTIKHDRWGVVERVLQQTGSHYEDGYVLGGDAGTVQFTAPSLVLNGTLIGHASSGAYQRDAASVAQGGKLVIGNAAAANQDYRAPSVTLSAQAPNIVVAADSGTIPPGFPLTLSTDYLTKGGFTRTEISSNGDVSFDANAPLTLLPGSSLQVYTTKRVDINSDISALAGNLSVVGGAVSVANNVRLDVSGTWINDTEVNNNTLPLTSLYQNAGQISLATTTQGSSLTIGENTQFIANGGAWLNKQGAVAGGRGGGIALQAGSQDSSFQIGNGIGLQAYGVNGASGGALTLAAGRIQITNGDVWATAQSYNPHSSSTDSFFNLGSSLFTGYGFGSVKLIASGGTDATQGDALRLASGTQMNATVRTLELAPQLTGHSSGGSIANFSDVTTLPDYQRSGANISLSVAPYVGFGRSTTLGTLNIQQGAILTGDPGTKISLASTGGSISVQGSVIARAGNIDMHINTPAAPETTPFDPNLQLTIGSGARLDASGIAVLTANDHGLLKGVVKDGGTLSLVADRGSVLVEHGASLDVSGSSTLLDVATAQANPYVRAQVASNAGAIILRAAESIGIYGDLGAHAGKGDTGLATGGTLSVALTRDNSIVQGQESTFPQGDRIVALTNAALPASNGAMTNGLASLSVAQVKQSGVDDLRLSAGTQILLDAGVDLSLQRRVQLDAPVLKINSVNSNAAATITSPYVLLGSALDATAQQSAKGGVGTLNVNAQDMIDVLGNSALQNIATANFNSEGDIRFRGTGSALGGSLKVSGDLTMAAQRVYAATATQFAITAANPDDTTAKYTVSIHQNGKSPGTPLSAASSIAINAANIIQNGTLLAPFGSIALRGSDSLVLGSGSTTSVSGDGALIPYGFTDANGANWYYQTGNTKVTDVPSRNVLLKSDLININQGAVVDLSGGGDLYASEWIKGTGGTNDAFGVKRDSTGAKTSVLTNPGLFAIMPALGSQVAPYDAQQAGVLAAQGLQSGDTVYLSGGGNLVAGFYTLLPASYSLLPGAYLVTAASGFANIQPGTTAALADGTPVVAGYRSFSNTGLGGVSYSGFAIYPGSWGRQLAEYKDSFAAKFFVNATRKTNDAGQLSIVTGNQLFANGTVNSRAANGGQAATIDVSARNLEIVGTIGSGATGVVQLADGVLNGWKAGRLLLGGTHTDNSTIAVAANSVTVASDAHLVGDEVALVAQDHVAINTGGSIKSNSAVADTGVTLPQSATVKLTGSGADKAAFVAVSDIDNIKLARDLTTTSSGPGAVLIDAGAQLASRGAVVIDAPGGAVISGEVGGKGASWSLGAGDIEFADNNVSGQLTVTGNLLNAMQSAHDVSLLSSGNLGFSHYANNTSGIISLGSNQSPLNNFTLQAATINNLSGGDSVELHADSITLNGLSDPASVTSATTGKGAFTLTANNIKVSGKALAVNGFGATSLNAGQQVSVSDSGKLVTGGNLNVVAARIGAAAASNGTLQAVGDVQLSNASTTAALQAPDLGGALTISGNNVSDNANIVAPSGIIKLNAINQLILGSQATIDVSGVPVYIAGVRADSGGGAIKLNSGHDLSAAAGSILSVAGSNGTSAGSITINAGGNTDIQSTLNGRASGNTGGSFSLQAGQLTNFAALSDMLQSAGFTARQSINVVQGDLALAANHQISAHDVQLVTDKGFINIAGTISAPSTDDRGSIRLYGADGVMLTGSLQANGDATTGRGGTIEIGVGTDVTQHPGARIDLKAGRIAATGGAQQGRLLLRAPVLGGNDIAITQINSDVSQLGSVTLEGVLPVINSTAQLSSMNAAATSFIDAAMANSHVQSLMSANNPLMKLSPGIELNASGDINLNALDLIGWQFNGTTSGKKTPAMLTVRAGGAINVNGTISDGFITTGAGKNKYTSVPDASDANANPTLTANPDSATLRLVAGSNTSSADPLAMNVGADTANLTLAAGVTVRTGTGDLSLLAAHDVIFAGKTVGSVNGTAGIDQYSRAYTGGINAVGLDANGTLDVPLGKSTTGRTSSFLNNGGQLLINAGHDVLGYALTDSVTAWQPRTGCVVNCGSLTADQRLTSWGVDIRQFLWNAGTLGGGDLTVFAGNDINRISAAAADSALEKSDKSAMSYYGGGALEVTAGNNINSGMLYAGRGAASVNAGGAVATSSGWQDLSGNNLGLFLTMGDSQVVVNARTGVALAGVTNPTLVSQPSITGIRKQSYFSTYGPKSSLSIASVAGDISRSEGLSAAVASFFGKTADGRELSSGNDLMPSSLGVQTLVGTITGRWGVLFPSGRGQLNMLAGVDIDQLTIAMPDISGDVLYAPLNPILGLSAPGQYPEPAIPAVRHKGDPVPAVFASGRDIVSSTLTVPKSILVSAGRDILGASITAQNVNDSDVSEIIVGRDLNNSAQLISVGGPGRLDIMAGRNIDLGAGQGILTTGNQNNANLKTSQGADLTVMAGMATNWDVSKFIDAIVTPSAEGAQKLIEFVQNATGRRGITVEEAAANFKTLSATQQRPFILERLFAELVKSGKEANADARKGFSRGYAAIDALMPGNRTAGNPYSGDINMLYSQIYTLSGGNINLFVPGGSLNVGVAAKPLFVTGLDKTASQLGIVAQKSGSINIFTNTDVSVNSSRIFTLGGGDISIWSTLGNIDAGKGAKTSLSVPLPAISFDNAGNTKIDISGAVAGSGIRTVQTDLTAKQGEVNLLAPVGFVNAGDAGIGSAGNINIAARQVIGAENINFAGAATGVPAATSGLAAALSGAAAVGGSSDNSSAKSDVERKREEEQKAPIAQAALSWLEVFVVGLGEENCKQDDLECLKRQQNK